jgi:hypothetical protein
MDINEPTDAFVSFARWRVEGDQDPPPAGGWSFLAVVTDPLTGKVYWGENVPPRGGNDWAFEFQLLPLGRPLSVTVVARSVRNPGVVSHVGISMVCT